LFDLFTRTRAIRRGVIQEGQAYDRHVLKNDAGRSADGADAGRDP
jgi:hypothetical protein